MVDWSYGYSAKYYMTKVDWSTMKDLDGMNITGGSIKRSLTDLRESADIECGSYDSTKENIIRIWLDAKQEGTSSHVPLFTGLVASPRNKYKGRKKTGTLECYSLLKIASDVLLPRGWYAPIDINTGFIIKELLSVLKLPDSYIHIAENTPDLKQAIIAEQGETRLSMVDKILDSMGDWRLRLDGYGAVYIEPAPETDYTTFDSMSNDVIETEIEVTYDWYSAPNVVRCVLDDSYAVVKDEDDNSPFSIQNRGREVWIEDTNAQLSTDETLSEYAFRLLTYYQQASTTISYTRRFNPDIYPSDRVRISYPRQEIDGSYLIVDQTISLGYNARTSEEVMKI